ncbi:MAG TPA: MG2 domain-containing protein, partial [Xanthomonadales bacterium]|nr:MG2 domain-containing protein [Xanthomonadales bacterium]
GFASQGSVLPAHEARGLPIVTLNVTDVDVEFLKVRDKDLPKFLQSYTANGRRSYWSLDELANYADSVYQNRFAIDSTPNERTLTYLPVRDIGELKAPGLYFAVMRRPGQFNSEFDTAMFFVSDIGLHLRAYKDKVLVHTASLETGEPKANVEISVRDKDGNSVVTGTTDGDGLATLAYKPNTEHVLVATWGRDISVLPFNQPALDLSEYAITGRPQRAAEIFPWSSRDLFRPGETIHVSALLRDDDGKSLPAAQPLFATLRQPDGRMVVQQQVQPGELGYYEFSREIPVDAPTGRWSVDFSTDPTQSDSAYGFRFRVEEFLPERLKLELTTEKERLAPGEALPLDVEADYLYGAPAAGNRFTAKLAVQNDEHPVESLSDFIFGDALVALPKEPQDAIDDVLDEDGKLAQEIEILKDTKITSPTLVVVSGSVFETGGRAVSRTLKRTVWPADQLVGVRPLFDLADGAPPSNNARFEVVRVDAGGNQLAAPALDVKLIRERRDYHWSYSSDTGWKFDYVQRFETSAEQKLAIDAGKRGELSFPVDWGSYRLEITDPETGLVMRLPFEAGWAWDDNQGQEARPDKVKLALDKTSYRGGDVLKVTLTPPHEGPALLLLEGDSLLWHKSLPVRAGTVVEIPLDPKWERHDLYLTALVFRPGSSADRITPKRAVGIAHVPIERGDRSVDVTLDAPE